MRLIRSALLTILVTAVVGCEKFDCQWDKPDVDLVRDYQGKDLTSLYDAHLKFTSRCTPSRTTLAPLVAEFGPQARSYAISRIKNGNYRSLQAALAVTAHVTAKYDSDCLPTERERLLQAIQYLSVPTRSNEVIRKGVMRSCSTKAARSPMNLEDYAG